MTNPNHSAAAARGRILYISHDVDQPRGGIAVLYRHVAALRAAGFDAYVVHTRPNFRYPHAPAEIPVIDASQRLALGGHDTLVFPEDHRQVLEVFRRARCGKVLFCQNHFFLFEGLNPGESWRDFGIEAAMCVSEPIRRELGRWFGIEAQVVPPALPEMFFCSGGKPSAPPLKIAYMPRKGAENLVLLRGLLELDGFARRHQVQWIEIEGLAPQQVAERLRQSHIYLSANKREGLGLPPLEAMAADCLVLGFAGGGGLDYARPDNGIWITDEDAWAWAAALRQTIEQWQDPQRRAAFDAMRAAGRQTARRYTEQRFEAALLQFWRAQLAVAPVTRTAD